MENHNQLLNLVVSNSLQKQVKSKRKNIIKSIIAEGDLEKRSFNTVCLVCLEVPSENSVITPCKHLFCYTCLSLWFMSKKSCPACKLEFS